ncbi:cysteine proteinase inhibitor 1-like [Lathyrus oleraceus]|uniref:cysteine proteinase inhibitor 1-like n=1 Tax=Pisum sativum TaxID=3888 RepID=UPI0021D1308C|nr:cysteine proteinase inhibitor 1-like [Pisum sativum]
MRFQSLSLLFLILFASATLNQAIPGGWTPIKNITDAYVIEIARFAVVEYDKLKGETLEFDKLIKGESQVVVGTNYHLTLSAKYGSSSYNYEAAVWDHPLKHLRNLTSFKRA